MQWSAGDTFTNEQVSPDTPTHLWVILSEPIRYPEQIVIVNVTSWREGIPYQDKTCVLEVGDHPFIRHKSWINYDETRCTTRENLDTLIQNNLLLLNEAVTSELLDRIQQGAALSPHTRGKIREMLEIQEIID
jgi:hypothetical protein